MPMNRRSFLKAGTAGVVGAGAVAATVEATAVAAATDTAEHPRDIAPQPSKLVNTICGVCFWKCGVTAEVGADGTLLHLRGNPKHPMSRGRLCPRGVGGIGMHEDSDRLTFPQIRSGRRGEGLFKRASQDEAFAEAGRLLKEVVDKHGPGALAIMTHGPSEAHFGHLASAIGTPHHTHPAYDQCKGPREVGFKLTFGHELKSPEPLDIENTDCLVLIGSHLGENMHNLQVQEFVTARTRGAKVIVVDPRRSTAAEKAHAWLPIKPGTDIALLLAWIHILIRDNLIDRDFIDQHCSGFDELAEHVRSATPEWAAKQTDLDAAEILRSAHLIGKAGPHVVFHPGRHVVWYGNDTQRSRAIAILTAITGSWGARGGYYLPHKLKIPSIHQAYPDMPPYPKMAERRDPGYPFGIAGNVNGIRQATLEGKIKAWIVAGSNLITSLPAQQETIAAIHKLDALVVVDILPTEITTYADVLLPAATYLERPDPLVATPNRDPYVAIPQPATEPIGESDCECYLAMGIGKAMGLGQYCPKDCLADFQRRIIEVYNNKHPHQPVDFEQLKRDGVVVFDDGRPIYRDGLGLGPDGTGRAGRKLSFPDFDGKPGANKVKLYSKDLEKAWREKLEKGEDPTGFEPLPTYFAPRQGPPGHVRLTYGRSPVHSFGRTQNTPVLHGREPENTLWASPKVAASYGVKDGDRVEVINQDGVREGPIKLYVTARMRDDAVYMTHGHGHNSRQLTRAYRKGADDSKLISSYVLDPLSGGTAMRVNFVRLVKPHAA